MSHSKTKVLYVSNFSDVDRGGQISLYNLVKRLDHRVFEAVVLCPEQGPLVALFRKEGIPVEFLDFPPMRMRNLIKILKAVVRFNRFVRRGDFSLIHTDSPRDTFSAALSLIFSREKIVWHARVSGRDPVYDRVNRVLASKIICVSESVKKRFEPCVRNNCTVVYNGVNLSKFSPKSSSGEFKREVGVPVDNLLVTTTMNVVPKKGAEEFVRAAGSLCQDRDNISFVVVGLGSDDSYIKKLRSIADRFVDRVRFVGYRRDIWNVLHDTDIFVLPSHSKVEGLPRVVIEAMACGVPVVGTDVEGINEAVVRDQTGLLVPTRNVPDLVDSIQRLLNSQELRHQLGRNGRTRAEEIFDIEKHVNEIEKLYRELLPERFPG